MEDKSKEQIIKETSQKLIELNKLEELEHLLKNNTIEFEEEGITYRVRKPTYAERQENSKERSKRYLQLLKDDNYILRDQLIQIYKKRDINIEDMEKQIGALQSEIKQFQLKLAVAKDQKDIDILKEEINKLMEIQMGIIVKKSDLLSMCIESNLIDYSNQYIVYMTFEKKDEDKWVRVFNSFEEFLNNESSIIDKAVYYSSQLIFRREDYV